MSSGRFLRSLVVLLCGLTLITTGPAAQAVPTPPEAAQQVSPFTVFDYYALPDGGKLGWSPVEGARTYRILITDGSKPVKLFQTVVATDEQFVEVPVGTGFSTERTAPNSAYNLRVQAVLANGTVSELSNEPVVYTQPPDTGDIAG
ncbi:hypothetical protein [Allokutzneria oryzae]|uniref:Fibronectin type-III domain-containing protein n=1 Tax=Allokutzneria oryzae TaxID=1378989 RepID=A0ABV6A137_9PSEU